jgi:phosphotriesterase-related protein
MMPAAGPTIMTVTGPVDPSAIGPTLMHEHVFVDLSATFAPVDDPELVRYRDAPVTDELLELLYRWPFSLTIHNGRLNDELLAIEEVGAFAASGGSLLVDCTQEGIGRDAAALPAIAEATGIHIVQGTGLYVEVTHPSFATEATVDDLAERFVRELTVGIGETGVRAGIIGEIGTSGINRASRQKHGDITLAEEKVLRAAAAASVQTGAAVTVHLDPRGTGAYRVIEVLTGEGVAPERMIMGHMDANPDMVYHLRVADTGVYVEYDHFGREYYAPHFGRP